MTLSQTELSLAVTDIETITASINGVDNPEEWLVTYENSDEEVITVTEVVDPETGGVSGYNFEALAEGTATVTFTATDGTDTATAVCTVTVTE